MAFFPDEDFVDRRGLPKSRLELLHKHECQVCPLYKCPGLAHPQMPASGATEPLLYVLGEAPGREEDREGIQFVGASGEVLRFRIPSRWIPKIRFNNVIRCRPPANRDPEEEEIEACRPSIVRDIEASKPKAIMGLGNVPLRWATGKAGVTNWSGRRIPVQIGSHTCWFFPILHPSYILRNRKFEPSNVDAFGCDDEITFAHDIRRALEQIDNGLPEPVVHTEAMARKDVEIIVGKPGELESVHGFLRVAMNKKLVGFDYETNMLRPYSDNAKILSLALSHDEGTIAFALDHPQARWTPQERETLQNSLRYFVRKHRGRKVVHSLPFELEWTAKYFGSNIIREGYWGCSSSQAYILDERPNCNALDFLCYQYFGLNLKSLSTINVARLESTDLEDVLRYNALDAKYHRLLYEVQAQRLLEEDLVDVYKHQARRIPTMVLTQIKGVPIHSPVVEEFYQKYSDELTKVEKKISETQEAERFRRLKRYDFRPSSLHDVAFVLYKMLKIYGDGTDEKALNRISHPFPKLILRWRKINKQLSTYIKPVREESGNLYNGKVHPVYNITSTRTWRTSAENPNVQNQPKHGDNRQIRKQIRPGDVDLRIVACDFAGIQARNVAMESNDRKLVTAFWNGYDIHGEWAHRIAKRVPSWLDGKSLSDKEAFGYFRQRAKNGMVFASFFGAGAKTVAGHLGIEENEAFGILQEFWDSFPEIKNWHKQTKLNYHATGYVTGLSGFRRRAPVRYNELINTPIQSDEAIIVCDAMSRLSEKRNPLLQPNIEIHDDLTFIIPKDKVDRCIEEIVMEMCRPTFPWINVPLGVEVSVGEDWYDMSKYGEYFSNKLGLGPEKPKWVK